ncbi:putative NAD(P)-binding domain superfamily [Helianthus anomalus]
MSFVPCDSSGMATYEPKTIIITGVEGFIAFHVVNRLITNYPDYKIVVLDKDRPPTRSL